MEEKIVIVMPELAERMRRSASAEGDLYIITDERITSLQERLRRGEDIGRCLEELEKILEIKRALLWRAEVACGQQRCGRMWDLAACYFQEVSQLEEAVEEIKKGNLARGAELLEICKRK